MEKKYIFFYCVMGLLLVLFTLLLSEVMYRAYLAYEIKTENIFGYGAKKGSYFRFYSFPAHVEYDESYGFNYNENGYVEGDFYFDESINCKIVDNFGDVTLKKDINRYFDADYKIALYGSSYTGMTNSNGDSVINLVANKLSNTYEKKIEGVNLSQGSTGVMQMVDLAVETIPTLEPDLIIFAINTSDVMRPRWWPIFREMDDGVYRFYMSRVSNPDNFSKKDSILIQAVAIDTITKGWCENINRVFKKSGIKKVQEDPLIKKIVNESRKVEMVKEKPELDVNLYALNVCYICNKALYGNAFYSMNVFNDSNPLRPIEFDDFNMDKEFINNIQRLNAQGIPYYFVHIPSYPEFKYDQDIAFGQYQVPQDKNRSLYASLSTVSDSPVFYLKNYYEDDIEAKPIDLVNSDKDWHPNEQGTEFMAEAISNFIQSKVESRIFMGNEN